MSLIEKKQKGPITTLWLNRPEVRNAFNHEVIAELTTHLNELKQDSSTRVVLLAGRGKVFSAGADLNWMKEMATASEDDNKQDALQLAQLFQTLSELPQVTIARVQGAALGGGIGLTAACDIAVAADDAKFGFTEVKLGLIPATIAPFVIQKIGLSAARRYFLTGEIFHTPTAQEIGLIHQTAPEDCLDEVIAELAAQILQNAPKAIAECKQLIDRVAVTSDPSLQEETAAWIARLRVSDEGQEGTAAFLEKRKPTWASKK